jgi:hypothetical protein
MNLSPRAIARVIDENTSVPLKVAVPIIIAIVTGVWWLSSQMADMRMSIARLEAKVDMAIGARADR